MDWFGSDRKSEIVMLMLLTSDLEWFDDGLCTVNVYFENCFFNNDFNL